MSDRESLVKVLVILDTIIQMSDDCEKNGGCMSLSGIASAHKMQTSIQKNKKRIQAIAAEMLKNEQV